MKSRIIKKALRIAGRRLLNVKAVVTRQAFTKQEKEEYTKILIEQIEQEARKERKAAAAKLQTAIAPAIAKFAAPEDPDSWTDPATNEEGPAPAAGDPE